MTHKDMAKWLRKAVAQKDWLMVAQLADEIYRHRHARIIADDEVVIPLHVARHCCEDMDAADYMAAEIARAEAAAQEAER